MYQIITKENVAAKTGHLGAEMFKMYIDEQRNYNLPFIYYISGIDVFDNMLQNKRMVDCDFFLKVHCFEKGFILQLENNENSKVVLSEYILLDLKNIVHFELIEEHKDFSKTDSESGKLLSSGNFGVLGLLAGDIYNSRKSKTAKETIGILLKILFKDGSVVKLFVPNIYWKNNASGHFIMNYHKLIKQ
jgi:hypothetical protein